MPEPDGGALARVAQRWLERQPLLPLDAGWQPARSASDTALELRALVADPALRARLARERRWWQLMAAARTSSDVSTPSAGLGLALSPSLSTPSPSEWPAPAADATDDPGEAQLDRLVGAVVRTVDAARVAAAAPAAEYRERDERRVGAWLSTWRDLAGEVPLTLRAAYLLAVVAKSARLKDETARALFAARGLVGVGEASYLACTRLLASAEAHAGRREVAIAVCERAFEDIVAAGHEPPLVLIGDILDSSLPDHPAAPAFDSARRARALWLSVAQSGDIPSPEPGAKSWTRRSADERTLARLVGQLATRKDAEVQAVGDDYLSLYSAHEHAGWVRGQLTRAALDAGDPILALRRLRESDDFSRQVWPSAKAWIEALEGLDASDPAARDALIADLPDSLSLEVRAAIIDAVVRQFEAEGDPGAARDRVAIELHAGRFSSQLEDIISVRAFTRSDPAWRAVVDGLVDGPEPPPASFSRLLLFRRAHARHEAGDLAGAVADAERAASAALEAETPNDGRRLLNSATTWLREAGDDVEAARLSDRALALGEPPASAKATAFTAWYETLRLAGRHAEAVADARRRLGAALAAPRIETAALLNEWVNLAHASGLGAGEGWLAELASVTEALEAAPATRGAARSSALAFALWWSIVDRAGLRDPVVLTMADRLIELADLDELSQTARTDALRAVARSVATALALGDPRRAEGFVRAVHERVDAAEQDRLVLRRALFDDLAEAAAECGRLDIAAPWWARAREGEPGDATGRDEVLASARRGVEAANAGAVGLDLLVESEAWHRAGPSRRPLQQRLWTAEAFDRLGAADHAAEAWEAAAALIGSPAERGSVANSLTHRADEHFAASNAARALALAERALALGDDMPPKDLVNLLGTHAFATHLIAPERLDEAISNLDRAAGVATTIEPPAARATAASLLLSRALVLGAPRRLMEAVAAPLVDDLRVAELPDDVALRTHLALVYLGLRHVDESAGPSDVESPPHARGGSELDAMNAAQRNVQRLALDIDDDERRALGEDCRRIRDEMLTRPVTLRNVGTVAMAQFGVCSALIELPAGDVDRATRMAEIDRIRTILAMLEEQGYVATWWSAITLVEQAIQLLADEDASGPDQADELSGAAQEVIDWAAAVGLSVALELDARAATSRSLARREDLLAAADQAWTLVFALATGFFSSIAVAEVIALRRSSVVTGTPQPAGQAQPATESIEPTEPDDEDDTRFALAASSPVLALVAPELAAAPRPYVRLPHGRIALVDEIRAIDAARRRRLFSPRVVDLADKPL